MVLQRRGPICMLGKSTSASRPSTACSWSRCSGGPTPAVSSTFTPNGCQLSLVRPARKSMKGTGRGSWPSTSSASPPSGRRIVRGALSLYLAGIRGGPALGKDFQMTVARDQGRKRGSGHGRHLLSIAWQGVYHRNADRRARKEELNMGAILGLGVTHVPLLAGRDEDMARILRRVLEDPDLPERYRRPEGWPEPMRQEWGADEGLGAARR